MIILLNVTQEEFGLSNNGGIFKICFLILKFTWQTKQTLLCIKFYNSKTFRFTLNKPIFCLNLLNLQSVDDFYN